MSAVVVGCASGIRRDGRTPRNHGQTGHGALGDAVHAKTGLDRCVAWRARAGGRVRDGHSGHPYPDIFNQGTRHSRVQPTGLRTPGKVGGIGRPQGDPDQRDVAGGHSYAHGHHIRWNSI